MLQLSRNGGVFGRHLRRLCSTKAAGEGKEDETPIVMVQDEEDLEARQRYIMKLRNKSRLTEAHRNMLNDEVPYKVEQSWVHQTLRYKRSLFGRYGMASGVDPRICFPTAEEKADKEEYERVAYPFTLKEMMAEVERQNKEKADLIRTREENIEKKLVKLEGWMKEVNSRREKKEAEMRAAKERKERLVEEVRRYFGYKVDHRDEKFKEMLEKKEKEDRKLQKEARKKQKEMKMLEKLVATGKAAEAAATEKPSEKPEDK